MQVINQSGDWGKTVVGGAMVDDEMSSNYVGMVKLDVIFINVKMIKIIHVLSQPSYINLDS